MSERNALPTSAWARDIVLQVREQNPNSYRGLGDCSAASDGGREWMIGFNASHEFFLVEQEDGTVLKRSVGESYEDDEELDIHERVLSDERDASGCYWGHW